MATKTLENREGFFRSEYSPSLPAPMTLDPLRGQERTNFLEALEEVEYVAQERAFKGVSRCRICGQPNGNSEFRANGWIWPSGYRHYIAVHNVRPSLAFQEMVLQKRLL